MQNDENILEAQATEKTLDELTKGELVDKLFSLRREREILDNKVKDIKKEEADITATLIAIMVQDDLKSLKTDVGTVSLSMANPHPQIKDKDAFIAFLEEANDFSMATMQVNKAAFKEYFESHGEYPPGVDVYFSDDLSVRKSR